MRANPPDFISQPVLSLSRSPCLVDGRLEPRHVDLRPFVLHGQRTRIVPGAFCRGGAAPGQPGGELEPGRRRQGLLGAAGLMAPMNVFVNRGQAGAIAGLDFRLGES